MNGEESGMKMFPIKWASFLSIFLTLTLFARQKNQPSYVIEVKKNSKLFEKPSSKGKIVGQVDEGTNLIFLEKSIHGRWIKVQDSDGVGGWLPKDRTDFEDIEKSVESMVAAKDIEKKEEIEKSEKEQLKGLEISHSATNYRLSPFYRILSQDKNFSSLLGLRFDINTGFSGLSGERKGLRTLSLEGALPGKFNKITDGYAGALRFAMKAPFFQSFFYSPDYGYSFENRNSSFYHHFSLGLTAGLDLGRIDARMRAGYEFFSGSHATIEVQLGCWF